MKVNKPLLIICIAIPLIVGAVSALLSGGGMDVFASVNKPPLALPAWIFPLAWTLLYTLMGISSYLILTSGASQKAIQGAMNIYVLQMLVNFLWPTFFFNFKWYLFAFFWLVLLWLLVLLMIWKFKDISKLAAILNIPYLLWLTFAGYLNFSIWLLNNYVG